MVPRCPFFLLLLQIMPPKRTKSSVATPAAAVVEQPQPQQLLAGVLPQALLEQIDKKVSDEVTRRLSSTSGVLMCLLLVMQLELELELTRSEVPALGIPADSPGESVIEGAVSQFQDRLSGELPTISPTLPNTLFISPSLHIDARVSAKLRAKILKNECIDLGALATNPV